MSAIVGSNAGGARPHPNTRPGPRAVPGSQQPRLPEGVQVRSTLPVQPNGPGAVPGSQQLRMPEGARAASTLPVQPNALRAGDGSRSAPAALVAVLACAPAPIRALVALW